jgi:hypothetical protein
MSKLTVATASLRGWTLPAVTPKVLVLGVLFNFVAMQQIKLAQGKVLPIIQNMLHCNSV